MIAAVTGEIDGVGDVLDAMHALSPISVLIEFGRGGIDLEARFWAEDNGVEVKTVRETTPVKAANAAMKQKPDFIVVLPGASPALVDRARRKGIQLCWVRENGTQRLDIDGAEQGVRDAQVRDEVCGDWPAPQQELEGGIPADQEA